MGTVTAKAGNTGGIAGYVAPPTTYGTKVTDCYYLSTSATAGLGSAMQVLKDNVFAKEATAFASGEVTYLLNGQKSSNCTFYQNIDSGVKNDYPVFNGKVVYKNATYSKCDMSDTPVVDYSNTNKGGTVVPNHIYEYKTDPENANVLVESCKNCSTVNETAALTLTDTSEEFIYNKKEHKPAADVEYSDGWHGEKTLTVKYENNINAGKANAYIEKDGAKATVEFTIQKATVKEPDIESKVYTGERLYADIPQSNNYKALTNGNGINVGSYDVVLKLIDPANYKWSSTEDETVKLKFNITEAVNSWVTVPSIADWTYGDTASVPQYNAKFGNEVIEITYIDMATGGEDYNSKTMPTKAGKYKAFFQIKETDNYSALLEPVVFEIKQRELTVDVKIKDKQYDGTNKAEFEYEPKLIGVVGSDDVSLESVTPTFATVGVADGITVNFKPAFAIRGADADNYKLAQPTGVTAKIYNNYTANKGTDYTVTEHNGNGWLNTDFVITALSGYLVSEKNTADAENWKDTLNYSSETADSKATFYVKNIATGAISKAVTENYKIDKTEAVGKVYFDEKNIWEKFLNIVTFGKLFYKDEVTVKAQATDTLSGVAKIEYAESNISLTLDEVKAITSWTEMSDKGVAVTLEDQKQFIYYVRITDKAGNVTYLSTDGAEYDTTAPAVNGVENGKTYCTTQKVTAGDKNFDTVTVNGVKQQGVEFLLDGNTDKTYTITATDKAGNSTTVIVTMKPIATLASSIDNITQSNVKSSDTDTIKTVKDAVAAIDTVNATDAEKQALKAITDKCDALNKKIADTKAEITAVTDGVGGYDNATVKSSDKDAIDALAARIDALLAGDNLTDTERASLTEIGKTVGDMLNKLSDIKKEIADVTEGFGAYDKKTVKSSDETDIEALIARIDALCATQNLTESERAALAELKETANGLLEKIAEVKAEIKATADGVEGYDKDTVTTDNKEQIEGFIDRVDTLLDGKNLTEDERKALEDTKKTAEDLIKQIEETASENKDVTTQIGALDKEKVTADDKENIEKLIDRVDGLLDGENLTEDERKALEDTKKAAEDLIKQIEYTAKENKDVTEKLEGIDKDKLTANDKESINSLIVQIDALLEGKNLTAAERKTLEDAKANAQSLIKQIDDAVKAAENAGDKSPSTMQNSNALWLALAFVCGGALTALAVLDRKKKKAKQ